MKSMFLNRKDILKEVQINSIIFICLKMSSTMVALNDLYFNYDLYDQLRAAEYS